MFRLYGLGFYMYVVIKPPTENQVFGVGSSVSRTQDSPARWGLATVLRVVNTQSITVFDWLLSTMNSDVTTDDSEDYSVSFNPWPCICMYNQHFAYKC